MDRIQTNEAQDLIDQERETVKNLSLITSSCFPIQTKHRMQHHTFLQTSKRTEDENSGELQREYRDEIGGST